MDTNGPIYSAAEWRRADGIAVAAYEESVSTAVAAFRKLTRRDDRFQLIPERIALASRHHEYLITRTISTPEADYPNLKRWDVVTPGFTWYLRRRQARGELQVLAAATIVLSIALVTMAYGSIVWPLIVIAIGVLVWLKLR